MKALLFVFASVILQNAHAIYFYLEPQQEKCFKDEVVKNYVSQLTS